MKDVWNQITVDLHRQSLDSAMTVASGILEEYKRSVDSIIIITGKGLHSKNQKAVIKPEIEGYLKRNGYWWSFPKTDSGKLNTGCYEINTFAKLQD